MNGDQMDDLKQLIATTISQAVTQNISEAEERIVAKIVTKLNTKIDTLRQEMLDGFASVGEAIDSIHSVIDNHETRIVTLETAA